MIAARAVEVREEAAARWGSDPPPEIRDALALLGRVSARAKPEAVLGPTMSAAVNTVSRRLREVS